MFSHLRQSVGRGLPISPLPCHPARRLDFVGDCGGAAAGLSNAAVQICHAGCVFVGRGLG